MQAVMMVAGKSTRTYPLTLTRPKPLLPILNRPLIYHSLDQMVDLFDKVILIVGYRQDMIRDLLGDEYRGIKIVYQEQKEQLGTGHAVLQAEPHIDGRFVVMNGDDLFAREDLEALCKFNNAALVKRVADPSLYGVYQLDDKERAIKIVEKPKEYLGDLANIGCYIFEKEIFSRLANLQPSIRNEYEITDAIQQLCDEKKFYVQPIKGFWLPTGFAWDLLNHQEYFFEMQHQHHILSELEEGVTIKGHVQIGKNTKVRSGVTIEGPAIIGDNCIIGPNCYIRQNSCIGDNCKIGHAVEIKNSIIMNKSNICHLSYVGDSVIGEGCNLGAGTITANVRHDGEQVMSMIKGKLVASSRTKLGCVMADGVHTGINTSIYPGRKFWPSTFTLPGEIVKKDKTDGSDW